MLQFASIGFDAAVEEIFPCLSCGAAVVLRTDAMMESVAAFVAATHTYGLTVWDLPTAYWHLVTRELVSSNLVLPESLRLVIIGGEQVLPERVRR